MWNKKEKSTIIFFAAKKCIYAHNNLMSQDIKNPTLYLNKHRAVQLKITEITYFSLCVFNQISANISNGLYHPVHAKFTKKWKENTRLTVTCIHSASIWWDFTSSHICHFALLPFICLRPCCHLSTVFFFYSFGILWAPKVIQNQAASNNVMEWSKI